MTITVDMPHFLDYIIGAVIFRGVIGHWLGYGIEHYIFAPVFRFVMKYVVIPFSKYFDRLLMIPLINGLKKLGRFVLRLSDDDIAYYREQRQARRSSKARV